MAKTKLTRNGETIYVDAGQVAQHAWLGWKTTPEVTLQGGVLAFDAVAVLASALAINALDNPSVGAGALENVHLRHYQVEPAAISATAIHAAANMSVAVQDITTAITDPDVPRTVTVKGNVSGITGNAVITGKNIHGEVISDTIALNGTGEIEGVKAFASVSNIRLPVQVHTPTMQVETATVVGTVTGSGNATVIVTAVGMTGSPKTKSVAVLENDIDSVVAGKIRTALNADSAVTALFTVGGAAALVSLTRKTPAADDNTLNISVDNDTCAGLTTAGTSANTTAGVPYDTVSVGRAAKLGIPHIVDYAACLLLYLFKGSVDTGGTLAVDADEVEKNLYTPAGTLDGGAVDLYYLA